MFIALLQSLSLAGASWFLLNTANPQTLFENTLLSVAVFYSYWVAQKLHQAAYWLPLLVIAGTITLSPNVHSVFQHQPQSVRHSPNHEGPIRTVPESAYSEDNEQVQRRARCALSIST